MLVEVPVASGAPDVRGRHWPRLWPEQEELLERQHDRLEALMADLFVEHASAQAPWSSLEHQVVEGACRRLFWDLRLHLRLEERWLSRWGVLCPAHREAHLEAAASALVGLQATAGDRDARRRWLDSLQAWFTAHRSGADAQAYALAHLVTQEP